MITEREMDLMIVEKDDWFKRLMEEYMLSYKGDRMVSNGEIYSENGGQPVQGGEGVRAIDQRVIGREPGDQIA